MRRALRPCATPHCPNHVVRGHCETHRRAREQRRGSAWSRGYDRAHQALRTVIVPRPEDRSLIAAAIAHGVDPDTLPVSGRDKVCRGCLERVATVQEHAIRIEDGGETSEQNCWGACDPCAKRKTVLEERDPSFGTRLRAAGEREGHVVPNGWRHQRAFGGEQ